MRRKKSGKTEVDILGERILPLEMLVVFLLVAVAGSVILYVAANKKWGYTKKRERELEEQSTFSGKGKWGRK
jgi:hypothetical protein